MKNLIVVVVAFLLLAGGYAAYATYRDRVEVPSQAQSGRYMDIESYVRTEISELSPVKEQLGGNFFVTALEAHGGAGTVSYEDGHNAYTADFTYHVTAEGQPVVDSFIIRPEKPVFKWDATTISLGGTKLLSIDEFPDLVKVSADAEFGSSDSIKGALLSPDGKWVAIAVGGAAHDFGWVYNITTKKLSPVIFSYGGRVALKGWNTNTTVTFTVTTPEPVTIDKTVDVTALPQYPR